MKGNDKLLWKSVKDKNGVYHWKKLKDMESTKTAFEYFLQFPENKIKYDYKPYETKLEYIKDEFKKHCVFIFSASWKEEGVGGHGINIAYDKLYNKKYEKQVSTYIKTNNIETDDEYPFNVSFLSYSNYFLYVAAAESGKIMLANNIKSWHKKTVYDILSKHFGGNIKWTDDFIYINIRNKKSI
jgi:hypothetical protein